MFREVDRLVDRNDGRDVLAVDHLEHRDAQDREVDLRDPLELPILREFLDARIDFVEPRGAFYLYIRVPRGSDPDPGTAFARRLLETRDVAVVPGAAFFTPEWIRISYAAPLDDVVEGVRRTVELMAG